MGPGSHARTVRGVHAPARPRAASAYSLPLVAVIALWGTIPVIVRQVDLPAAAIVAARLWLAALGLALVVLWERRTRRTSGPRVFSVARGRCAALSVVLAVHWIAEFAAFQRAPIGTVIFIVYLAPIGVALAAPRMLGERLTTRTVAALALAFGGFALLAWRAVSSAALSGLVAAGIAAVTFVLLVLWSKPLAAIYGGVRAALIEMTGAGVLLVPVAAAAAWGAPKTTWLWLPVLGIVHTALAIAVYLHALPRVGATRTAILGYIEPASAVVWAWLFLGEAPAVATIVGGVAIVMAALLVVNETTQPVEVPVHVPR